MTPLSDALQRLFRWPARRRSGLYTSSRWGRGYADVEAGFVNGEFVPFFQPIMDAQSRDLAGFEVLARQSNVNGRVSVPDQFFPALELLGRQRDLDRNIFAQAISQREKWATTLGHTVPLSFNISLERLFDPVLPLQFKELGAAAKGLSLELLETIYLDDPDEATAELIHMFRNMGITIEIDDFGTGKTSLLALTSLRPNRIKLDKRLVAPTTDSKECREVVASIISISLGLGIPVTAEGIESDACADLMTELGCDKLQGFHLGKPMPASAASELLESGSTRARG